MGVYNGKKVCKPIGVFLLDLLGQQFNTRNIGLYRVDGQSIFKNCSSQQMERLNKHLQKLFQDNVLDVIIEYDMKIVHFFHFQSQQRH